MKGLKEFKTHRLVKSEDINHHGTLYAGRGAEWFVESGFVAATNFVSPKNLLCVKIHGMHFQKPARPGEVVCYSSKVAYTGTTSFITYIKVTKRVQDSEELLVEGFISFVHVDENSKPKPHNIEIHPHTPEDIRIYELAKQLKDRK